MDTCALANLGNTCFMNAALQIMSHIPELGRLVNIFKKHAKHHSPETRIFEQWLTLNASMHSPPFRVIQPVLFAKTVHSVAQKKQRELFTGWMQNDMPEFLLFMVECMHESISRPIQMTISGKADTPKDALALQCFTMLQKVYKKEYSEIMALLYGISLTTISSADGTWTPLSHTPEPFFMVDLPISGTTLIDCINLYTQLELMFGENKWYNEKTQTYENVYRHIEFWCLPDILVFVLNRYTSQQHKLETVIQFPVMECLDMSSYVQGYNPKSYVYELFGVCNHMGNMMGGHYTAFVKASSGLWFHYNDSQVERVQDPQSIVTPMAYCLFYRKKCT